jgi:hypothetical protein
MEFIKGVHIVLVKVTNFCSKNFRYWYRTCFALPKEVSVEGQGLTAVEKISIKKCSELLQ